MAGTSGSPSPPPRRWHQLVRGRYRCALRGAPGPHLRHPLRTGGATPPAWRATAAAAREKRPAARSSKPAPRLGAAFGVKLSETGYSFLLKTGRFNRTLGWGGGGGPRSQSSKDGSATMREAFLSARPSFKTLLNRRNNPWKRRSSEATRVSKCFKAAKSFCRCKTADKLRGVT